MRVGNPKLETMCWLLWGLGDTEANIRLRDEVSTAEKRDRLNGAVRGRRRGRTFFRTGHPIRCMRKSASVGGPCTPSGEGGHHPITGRAENISAGWPAKDGGAFPDQTVYPPLAIVPGGPWRPACSAIHIRIRGKRAPEAVFDGVKIAPSLPWRWRWPAASTSRTWGLPDPSVLNILSTVY